MYYLLLWHDLECTYWNATTSNYNNTTKMNDTIVSNLSSSSFHPHYERRRENEDTFDENEVSHAKIDLGSPSKQPQTTSSRLTSSPSSHKSLRLIDLSSGTGTKGNAFARVDNVEVISRSGNSVILHPMTVLFPES